MATKVGDLRLSEAPVRTQAIATTTANVNCGLSGDVQITATASPIITPTGTPNNGRQIILEVLASGAERIPAMATSVFLTRDITSRSLTVPQNQVGIFGLRYSTLRGGWILLAATITA